MCALREAPIVLARGSLLTHSLSVMSYPEPRGLDHVGDEFAISLTHRQHTKGAIKHTATTVTHKHHGRRRGRPRSARRGRMTPPTRLPTRAHSVAPSSVAQPHAQRSTSAKAIIGRRHEGAHSTAGPTEEASRHGKSPLIGARRRRDRRRRRRRRGRRRRQLPPVLELSLSLSLRLSPSYELSEQIDDGRRAHCAARRGAVGRVDDEHAALARGGVDARGPSSPSVDRGADENGSDEGGADGADGDASAAKRRRALAHLADAESARALSAAAEPPPLGRRRRCRRRGGGGGAAAAAAVFVASCVWCPRAGPRVGGARPDLEPTWEACMCPNPLLPSPSPSPLSPSGFPRLLPPSECPRPYLRLSPADEP